MISISNFSRLSISDWSASWRPAASSRQAENVLIFGAPGVGNTHLAIALGRAVVEAGHSVLFTSATALLAALSKAKPTGS